MTQAKPSNLRSSLNAGASFCAPAEDSFSVHIDTALSSPPVASIFFDAVCEKAIARMACCVLAIAKSPHVSTKKRIKTENIKSQHASSKVE